MLETFWVSYSNLFFSYTIIFFVLFWVDCIRHDYKSLLRIMQFTIKCLLKMFFFFTLKKCQAKLVSVRLNEIKFRARTLYLFILFSSFFGCMLKVVILIMFWKKYCNKKLILSKYYNLLDFFNISWIKGKFTKVYN